MSHREKLAYKIVEDRHGDPLAIIDGFPGLAAELTLDDLSALRLQIDGIENRLRACIVQKLNGQWP